MISLLGKFSGENYPSYPGKHPIHEFAIFLKYYILLYLHIFKLILK